METPDLILLWLDHTVQLTQRICVVVVAAFVSIRIASLRRTLRAADTGWRYRAAATAFFAVLAIIGTHSGIVIDLSQGGRAVDWGWPRLDAGLGEYHAVIGFRDSMTMVAGLVGGPWVGLGAGFLAGAERAWLAGFVGPASGAATLALGLGAGLARRRFPRQTATAGGVLGVALAGSLVHRFLLLLIAGSSAMTLALTWQVVVPVIVVNSLGCLLFLWIMRDLDRDWLEGELRDARLAALQAQMEPHFLNNTLTAIQQLTERVPAKACDSLAKLARLFDDLRQWAGMPSIPLQLELEHLDRYLELQKLRFEDVLEIQLAIGSGLGAYRVPPRTLQILAENALTHGFRGRPRQPLRLRIEAAAEAGGLVLRVSDDGRGIPPDRLRLLGRQRVDSTRGSGTGLYRLCQSLELYFRGQARFAIDSQPGAGTTVVLTLPAWSEA